MMAFRIGIVAAFRINFWIVLASMVGFGSMVQSSNLELGFALGATIGLWGLPGQIAMVEQFIIGAPLLAIILASSLANLRFMPMAVVMLPLLQGPKISIRSQLALVQLMSVNIWTITMDRICSFPFEQRKYFYLGVSLTCLLGGVIGTFIGFVLAGSLALHIKLSLLFLNPIYFLFVFFSVRQRGCFIAVIIAAIIGPLLYQSMPNWGAPVTGILGGSLAFYLDYKILPMGKKND